MEFNRSVALLLFLAFFLSCTAELGSGAKKRGDITQKSNSNEETEKEEDITVEEIESTFEQLRELGALHDTILKLAIADPIHEKISKQIGKKDGAEGKTETTNKETLESSAVKNVWSMISQAKDIEPLDISGRHLDEEDIESWDQDVYELEEEIQEPLSPEEQAGKIGDVLPGERCDFFKISS